MAGNYPDPVSNRLAYDLDGTQVYRITSNGVVIQLSSPDVVALNDENIGTYVSVEGGTSVSGNSPQMLLLFFPEKRDISGYFIAAGTLGGALDRPRSTIYEVSTDTTNGIDGSWTQIGSPTPAVNTVTPTYRSGVVSASSLGVKAVRFRDSPPWDMAVHAVHLYGRISAGENPNRLAIYQQAADAQISGAHLDWGDVPRSSSADRVVRIKNISSTLTANNVQLVLDTLTDATPSVPGQFTLSDDGINFTANLNIGNLAPGGLSGPITIRRVTPSNAQLSVWTARLTAQAVSWS